MVKYIGGIKLFLRFAILQTNILCCHSQVYVRKKNWEPEGEAQVCSPKNKSTCRHSTGV